MESSNYEPHFAEMAKYIKEKYLEKLDKDQKLKFYSLYKQATEGDNNTEKPGMFSIKEKYKWEAWSTQKGKSQEQAKKEWLDFAVSILPADVLANFK
jgi:diazepam-binding inhibitor (GABA receptor modulating acyl-CoA-binding protein)